MTYDQAVAGAATFNLGGNSDWRLPTVQELYSLVSFAGSDPTSCETAADCPDARPFIDTGYFTFQYGQPLSDAPFISSTPYAGSGGLVFGVNFADGRVIGYPTGEQTFFMRYVRGAPGYGMSDLVDNGDGMLSDQASGLTWMQTDSQQALAWADALAYCEVLSWAGNDDWRLPNAKELYSIVDTTRAPDVSNTAAANSLFQSTPFTNENGQPDYGYYWSAPPTWIARSPPPRRFTLPLGAPWAISTAPGRTCTAPAPSAAILKKATRGASLKGAVLKVMPCASSTLPAACAAA